MKLAVLGVAAIITGFAIETDGLIYVGALWIAGGVLMRVIVGSPKNLAQLDAKSASFGDVFGGKRGAGSALAIVIGGASVVIGLIPVGFESDDAWRWAPVAIGGLLAGMQLLALVMFSAGSGLQALTGDVGNPTHPAKITLNDIRETGMRINDQPRLELDLTIAPDGGAAYDTSVKQVISHSELGSLRPGTTYEGLVDLDVAEGVRINWFSPIGATTTQSADEITSRLSRLDTLRNNGVITDAEHAEARAEILDEL